MNNKLYNDFVKLLKEELVPALGCTEPIAIAYAAAKCKAVLGTFPQNIKIGCSGNIIKNVQGVTVPNSGGLKGICVAATLGCVGGNEKNVLEVLKTITQEDIKKTKLLVSNKFCETYLIEDCDNLFIKVDAYYKDQTAQVILSNNHTNISKIVKNGKVIFEPNDCSDMQLTNIDNYLKNISIGNIVEFANNVEISEIENEIKRQIEFNTAISNEGLKNDWGLSVGKTIRKYYDANDVRIRAISAAAAGSDARMGGCSMPVIINSGSGNQGITIALPIIEYAKKYNICEEKLIRSIALANLISIEEKSKIGSLSAYCGAVCAGIASATGIAFLLGGDEQDISNVITNGLANVGGIVCDGAKPSCAAKIASAVQAGIWGYEIGMKEHKAFQKGEGLVKSNADKTIASFGRLGKYGMKSTDIEILNIMLEQD